MDERSSLLDKLEPVVTEVRRRRSVIEQSWLVRHAAWMGVRYPGRYFYNSKNFQHYLPVGRRAIERTTVRVRQLVVPDNDYFEVYPGDPFDVANAQSAESVTAWMAYLFDHKVHVKRLVSELTRCFLLYDRAITKSSIQVCKYSEDPEGKLKRTEIFPSLRAVDPFSFFVFPETVTDLGMSQLVFEDAMYSIGDYREAVEASGGLVKEIDFKDLTKPEWPTYHQTRLALTSITDPTVVAGFDEV